MISLVGISKTYATRTGSREVLSNINLTIKEGESVGIIGLNGAGKSTLIRIISGSEEPTQGKVNRGMSVSWPLAFAGGLQGSLTGLDNVRFVCRVYGVDISKTIEFVEKFSGLGNYLREPFKTYSSGMRMKLAFSLSMAIDFDCYLIDEIIAVGDTAFQDRCVNELFVQRKDKAKIIVSHVPEKIQNYCSRACVLKEGVLHQFSSVDAAFDFYHSYSNYLD